MSMQAHLSAFPGRCSGYYLKDRKEPSRQWFKQLESNQINYLFNTDSKFMLKLDQVKKSINL